MSAQNLMQGIAWPVLSPGTRQDRVFTGDDRPALVDLDNLRQGVYVPILSADSSTSDKFTAHR
ncbi:hypothetical protein ACFWJT_32125 [Streptomyces sp. NPDC127069]|uniref:hypothetical protein n=1 Tax=unclassified Streptomyces TaxID=2593676 RepID=UPI003669EA3E